MTEINWTALLAAFDEAGYAIVPKEPTPEQYVKIMGGGIDQATAQAFYRAMIAAAPKVTE